MIKTSLQRVLDSDIYKSGAPFKSDAVQRVTRDDMVLSEQLIAEMLEAELIRELPHSGKPRENSEYVRYDKVKDLAMCKPWRVSDGSLDKELHQGHGWADQYHEKPRDNVCGHSQESGL